MRIYTTDSLKQIRYFYGNKNVTGFQNRVEFQDKIGELIPQKHNPFKPFIITITATLN